MVFENTILFWWIYVQNKYSWLLFLWTSPHSWIFEADRAGITSTLQINKLRPAKLWRWDLISDFLADCLAQYLLAASLSLWSFKNIFESSFLYIYLHCTERKLWLMQNLKLFLSDSCHTPVSITYLPCPCTVESHSSYPGLFFLCVC